MRPYLLVLFLALLIWGCNPKTTSWKNGNLLKVKMVGVMDTTTTYVSGKVLDLDYNLGLKGAQVALKNEQYSFNTTCKGDGIFSFGHIPSGTYIVKSTFIGYYRLEDTITVKSGEIVKLKIMLGTD